VLGIERLQEAYVNLFTDYPKGIIVPAIVEIETGQVVTNNYPPDHPRPVPGMA
jgi:glutathionyl-hydroquinone reductase